MNPFTETPKTPELRYLSWEMLWPEPYDKRSVDPYTRARLILMTGTEFENVWFGHQFSRCAADGELRRRLAALRRSEQQQQKLLCHLKPPDETALEHTIGYEQLATDLTAHLAQRVESAAVKAALDFALLEDFDHLYRYADYLDASTGEKAEQLVGRYTEIMPGRPTIAHHRHPFDSLCPPSGPKTPLFDTLAANVITAAEQQTMNYYMNTAALWPEETGRRLYQEIGMVEEQHVTRYGSLLDPRMGWCENLLLHQYVECWLYWSCAETETDGRIQGIWQFLLEQELAHLRLAADILRRQTGKDWRQVIPEGRFPAPLRLESNIDYVRGVLAKTAYDTALGEGYRDARGLEGHETFEAYQRQVNEPADQVMSHRFIQDYMDKNGRDYRFETAPHPIEPLRCPTADDVTVGRMPGMPGM